MGGIILRTSQLDPDVLVSPHPAPDVLGLRLGLRLRLVSNLNRFKPTFRS